MFQKSESIWAMLYGGNTHGNHMCWSKFIWMHLLYVHSFDRQSNLISTNYWTKNTFYVSFTYWIFYRINCFTLLRRTESHLFQMKSVISNSPAHPKRPVHVFFFSFPKWHWWICFRVFENYNLIWCGLTDVRFWSVESICSIWEQWMRTIKLNDSTQCNVRPKCGLHHVPL